MLRSVFLAVLTVAPIVATSQSALTVADVPVLNVNTDATATAILTLRNSSSTPEPLHLHVGDFLHTQGGRQYPLGTGYTLEPYATADKADFDRGKVTTTLHVKVTVTHLWEAGQSSAVVTNGDADIPTASGAPRCVLVALRIPTAYNIQVESGGNAGPEIAFSKFGNTLVRLTNTDPMNYRFRWQLRSGDSIREVKNPLIELPANGSAYLDMTGAAPDMSVLEDGTIRDGVTPGELVLQPVLDATVGLPPLAPKILPVSLRLQYWGEGLQQAVTIFCVFLLLTLGGMTSIWVHCGMPNTDRALAITRSLREFQVKLDGIGPDVPSRARALLEGHIEGVSNRLKSTWWIFPSFGATLDAVEKQMGMLSEWLDVSYGVSTVLHQTRQLKQTGIPPTVLHWIKAKCNCAVAHFETGFTTPEEIVQMHADLNAARSYMSLAETGDAIPELEKAIQEREEGLGGRLPEIEVAFPGRFTVTIERVRNQIGQPLAPAGYLDRDTLSLKADLIGQAGEWINRATNTVTSGAGVGGSATAMQPAPDSALGRLRKHQERLIAYLEPDAPEGLKLAWLFVAEMRQDIYEEALLQEAKADPPQLTIVAGSSDCACGTALLLGLKFKRQILNDAVASQEWTCTWDFGDGTIQETGWEVYHSYRRPGEFTVSVSITDLDGELVLRQPFTTQITAGIGRVRQPWAVRVWNRIKPHAETMMEASRLAMVLALAVFGLVGSAQHQVESLTLIQAAGAVFALGFGADTLKNLIAQKGATK